MRFLSVFVCLLVLSACERQSETPAEKPAGSVESTEPTVAEESPAEVAEVAGPAEPEAMPEAAVAPAPEPDPNAPADVAAPPAGAKRTQSGLAWKRLAKGKGTSRPGDYATVTIAYVGWTPDGRRFDDSTRYGKPISVRVDHLIPGLSETLRTMTAGERRRVWVPAKLGYGALGADVETAPRQPLGDLVFEVELVEFRDAPPPPPAPKSVGEIPSDATIEPSGLAWRTLEAGMGTEHPKPTSVVEVSYTLWTADGKVVDSSVFRTGVDTIGISSLVPGWAQGMMLMVPGERRLFWIPEELAYQGAALRPPGMLVVDVKLVGIRQDLHQVR